MAGQLDLFGGAGGVQPIVDDEVVALRRRLPPRLYLGTCSWTFPGWSGVWAGQPTQAELVRRGLHAYARHPLFSTVEIDRSYYGPLSSDELHDYATQLPPGFPVVSKLWNELTTPVFADHPRWGARAGQRNQRFLDPELGQELLAPYRQGAFSLHKHAGPFILSVPPLAPSLRSDPLAFCRGLERLLDALPEGRYAVEVRNRELRVPRLGILLRDRGCALVLNWWSGLPDLAEQRRTAPRFAFYVVRLMLPPNIAYDDRKAQMAPFDRVRDPQPAMRRHVVELLRDTLPEIDVYVLANNKAEGSAPGTLRAIAEELVETTG